MEKASTKRLTVFLNRKTPPHIMTLVLLAGISALTMNIFLPSLPSMSSYFNAPYQVMQLSVTLYLALSAVMQVLIGPISDRFGRRKVILGALFLFLLSTIGTLLAETTMIFLFFRMSQAVIAAGMVLSRAVVRDMVPDAEAASMIGYVTMGMALVPMVGPICGGFLDDHFGWQANFLVLFILGLLVFGLVWLDLGETAQIKKLGFCAQLAQYLALLRSPRFWGYSLCAAFSSGAFFAYLGGAPFVGTEIFGLTASQVGIYFSVPALGYALGNFISGQFSIRIGLNKMAILGTVLTTIAMTTLALLTYAGLHFAGLFFGMMSVIGLGNGITLPNVNAGMMSIKPELAGTASGLGGALMIGGGAVLAALAGAVLSVKSGEMPLVLLMLLSSIASLLTILAVIRRAKRLGIEI
ncbi:MAG: DHA1 family bicyclomycin/chloramphenicol resistance-like MFS transporter [Paracoccaceae bacterium]|jgi:DHA1 family bicyclomycin/chloramphenicol resistance-like MFS transporter